VLVKDINPGSEDSIGLFLGRLLTNCAGKLFLGAYEPTHGQELWASDGTAATTVRVRDIWPGSEGSYPFNFTNVAGTLFFSADDGTRGEELWKAVP
jgi:ELWxxDGT repeat protein